MRFLKGLAEVVILLVTVALLLWLFRENRARQSEARVSCLVLFSLSHNSADSLYVVMNRNDCAARLAQ